MRFSVRTRRLPRSRPGRDVGAAPRQQLKDASQRGRDLPAFRVLGSAPPQLSLDHPSSPTAAKENAMLPLMMGMGVPVFAVIAYALLRPNPESQKEER